jgi:hypothetical protein
MAKSTGDKETKSLADMEAEPKQEKQEKVDPTADAGAGSVDATLEPGNGQTDQADPATTPDAKSLREELKAEILAELRAERAALVATAAPLAPVTVAAESVAQDHERRLTEKLKNVEDAKAVAESSLSAGSRQFSVGLKGNPTRIVGGEHPLEAEQKYRDFFGIRQTEHRFEVSEVSA